MSHCGRPLASSAAQIERQQYAATSRSPSISHFLDARDTFDHNRPRDFFVILAIAVSLGVGFIPDLLGALGILGS